MNTAIPLFSKLKMDNHEQYGPLVRVEDSVIEHTSSIRNRVPGGSLGYRLSMVARLWRDSPLFAYQYLLSYNPRHEKKTYCCICDRAADQRLCLRYIVQSLYFINSKFQASSHLVWLHSLVCVGPDRKSRRYILS